MKRMMQRTFLSKIVLKVKQGVRVGNNQVTTALSINNSFCKRELSGSFLEPKDRASFSDENSFHIVKTLRVQSRVARHHLTIEAEVYHYPMVKFKIQYSICCHPPTNEFQRTGLVYGKYPD